MGYAIRMRSLIFFKFNYSSKGFIEYLSSQSLSKCCESYLGETVQVQVEVHIEDRIFHQRAPVPKHLILGVVNGK